MDGKGLYVTYENNRFMYSGDKIILFGNNPIPAYREAFNEGNHSDMRGAVVRAKKSFMRVTPGMLGIVYETYKDFDNPNEFGWSIIFESGSYDGFSFKEREEMDMVELVGVYPPAQDYEFTNVMQLEKDFRSGKFKFK